jgi:hypothetical protein
MVALPFLSRAAQDAGVPPRYRYWVGRSTRRYLFSEIDAGSAADFGDSVAIATTSGRIVWAGCGSDLPGHRSNVPRDAQFSVHLLANTAEECRRIIDDLRPEQRPCLKLAA